MTSNKVIILSKMGLDDGGLSSGGLSSILAIVDIGHNLLLPFGGPLGNSG